MMAYNRLYKQLILVKNCVCSEVFTQLPCLVKDAIFSKGFINPPVLRDLVISHGRFASYYEFH